MNLLREPKVKLLTVIVDILQIPGQKRRIFLVLDKLLVMQSLCALICKEYLHTIWNVGCFL